MKIKHFTLSIFLLTFSLSAFAQKDSNAHPLYVYVEGGYGVPVGLFGYSNTGNENSNNYTYANPGSSFNIFCSMPVEKSIYEAVVMFGYNYNTYNTQDYFPFHSTPSVQYSIIGLGGNYEEIRGMIGFSIPIPQNWKRACFNILFLIGGTEVYSPYLSYETFTYTGPPYLITKASYYISAAKTLSLVAGGGIGAKIYLYKKIFLALNIDYFTTTSEGIATEIQLFNFTAGIGYRFGK